MIKRPRIDAPVSRFRDCIQNCCIHPADVQFCIYKHVVYKRQVSSHIHLGGRVQVIRQTYSFTSYVCHYPIIFGYQLCTAFDEWHTTWRRHELCVLPWLYLKVKLTHLEEGLHRQAVCIVGKQNLLHLIRLIQSNRLRPWLLSCDRK